MFNKTVALNYDERGGSMGKLGKIPSADLLNSGASTWVTVQAKPPARNSCALHLTSHLFNDLVNTLRSERVVNTLDHDVLTIDLILIELQCISHASQIPACRESNVGSKA